jgi:hypothetical protein
VAPLPPSVTADFHRDLRLAQADVSAGVVPTNAQAASAHWALWTQFCDEHGLDPSLADVPDPIPYLQVFAYRYRQGIINTSRRPVRSRTVESALRSVGQALTSVGSPDPRLTLQGHLDFRLKRMLACYGKRDSPPARVKPIPVPILRHVMAQAVLSQNSAQQAFADMICLAFFFLLRPGEYTGSGAGSHPFLLEDVQLFLGATRLNLATAPPAQILAATFVTLRFTSQKNGVRGEVMGLGRSGDPHFCPVTATARRVLHLRTTAALPTQPLASYHDATALSFRRITPADLTALLRLAVRLIGTPYGFLPEDISARSLRAAGAMALLCASIDSDRIRLLGRWRSDEMLRYLHVQAEPVMRHFASQMLIGGNFTLIPNNDVPIP